MLTIYFQLSNPAFLSIQNIQTFDRFTGATIIIAVGEVLLLILGEIDLSVGNTSTLAPFIMCFVIARGSRSWAASPRRWPPARRSGSRTAR